MRKLEEVIDEAIRDETLGGTSTRCMYVNLEEFSCSVSYYKGGHIEEFRPRDCPITRHRRDSLSLSRPL